MPGIDEAASDLKYLLNRGYKKTTALTIVANRYGLAIEDRNFLHRYVFSDADIALHRSRLIPLTKARGKTIVVDGYNVLITAEAVLGKARIVESMDGVLRDASAAFSSYRFTEETKSAVGAIIAALKKHKPSSVLFIFDSQMSNSGALASYVRRKLHESGLSGDARTSRTADRDIAEINEVTASSDSIIIEKVERIIDICSEIRARAQDQQTFM
jgi:hypothetical protein